MSTQPPTCSLRWDTRTSATHRAIHSFEVRNAAAFRGFGEHIDNPIKIDLHTRITGRLPARETDITSVVFPEGAPAGLNSYPSTSALMAHLLLHAASNMRGRALRFIQLHDIAMLATQMRVEHWHELLRLRTGNSGLWWALAPLELTNRYFSKSIPREVIDATAPGCPWLLRKAIRRHTLLDVSWARLRIQAFPGIEWSRSLPEALLFMARRIVPDRARSGRLLAVTTKSTYGASVPWYGLSQRGRIWRWVVSSPPRVQAIYPIRVALGIQPP